MRAVVDSAGPTGVLDEALLLTTELVTNAVVHARTDLDLEIRADGDTVTITVVDFQPGPLTDSRWAQKVTESSDGRAHELDERGRGLLLVDRLASCWGTLQYSEGKGVWFRLDTPGRPGPPPRPPLPADGSQLPPERLVRLALGPAQLRDSLDVGRTVEELLRRLCEVLGAPGAAVVVDEGAGVGPRTLAVSGMTPRAGVRSTLRLSRPWRGELTVSAAGVYAAPLAELAAERVSLLVENDRLRRTDRERRSWLNFLAEASELLAQSLDVDLTMALIPQLVVPRLGEWCAVHRTDEAGRLRLAAVTHADETAVADLTKALDASLPQLRQALESDRALPLADPLEGYAVALLARGQQLGTLAVGRAADGWRSPEELAVVEDVARRAALALDNCRIHADRRAVAEGLQRSLLPPTLPRAPGLDFGAEYVPAGEGLDVGGDFYDVVQLPHGRWLVIVGDVSGKGVHAATVTGLVREVTRTLVRDDRDLPEVLERLNETLVQRGRGRFCTLALAAVTPAAQDRLQVELYLAGHDQPVLLGADGGARPVGRCGTALGLLTTIVSPVSVLSLEPGETLVFYTDGVTERRRGDELFGIERLCREAAAVAGFPADVVAARLRAAVLSFSPAPPRDDIAVFALRNSAS